MLELAGERGVSLPADAPEALADRMLVPRGVTLEAYLERFSVTLSVMQDAEALERIAAELVVDHAAENVRYVEVRFCPALSTERGLTSGAVVEAVLRGLRRGEATAADATARRDAAPAASRIRAGLIVCGLRSLPSGHTLEMAELAAAFHGRGVCGFDLAGAEEGHPVKNHAEACDRAARAGVPITIHAGEGYGPESIREAIELGHARRIGHGTRLAEDPALLEVVRTRRIPLEVCLTSNVQTGVARSYAEHPALGYLRAGIPVTLGTDNRLMSGVTLADEYRAAAEHLGLGWAELVAIARTGFEHAFVSEAERLGMVGDFEREVAALG